MPAQLVKHVHRKARPRGLLRKEEQSCEVQLFIVGVARELDHLTVIEEWWRDGVDRVDRTDEKKLRKIDRHVNLMILSIIQIVPRNVMSGHWKRRSVPDRAPRAGLQKDHRDSLTDRLSRSHRKSWSTKMQARHSQ